MQEWDTDTVFQVKQKLERLRVDSEDVEACLSYLNRMTHWRRSPQLKNDLRIQNFPGTFFNKTFKIV